MKHTLIFAQTTAYAGMDEWPQLSKETVLDSGLRHSPGLKAAASLVGQQQNLLPAAVSLPKPQLIIQNTSGDFFAVGFQQNMEFPTVYGAQNRLQKQNIVMAETSRAIDIHDKKYELSVYYTELQYRYLVLGLWQSQDSLFRLIAESAGRQFRAGQVDLVQASLAEAHAGQVRIGLIQAEAAYIGIMRKIQQLTGIRNDFVPVVNAEPEDNQAEDADTSVGNNPVLVQIQQTVVLSHKKWNLEKHKVMPGLMVGMLNNGPRETTYPNWIYAGIEIPLWFWQYKGSIAAAKNEMEVNQHRQADKQMELKAELENALVLHGALADAMQEYETRVIPKTDQLSDAATRLFQAGAITYTDLLRTLNDAAEIRKSHWETLKNYQQNFVYIQYLTGTL